MPKERGYNPVQAQRKAEKARTIKKGIVPTSIRCNVTSTDRLRGQARQSSKQGETRN